MFTEFDGFCRKNVSPDTKSNLPVCPHYNLIEICSKFSNTDLKVLSERGRFCGQKVKYEDTLGPLCGHKGETFIPATACLQIRDQITEMLYWAKKDITAPDENTLKTLETEKDSVKKETLLQKSLKHTKEYNRKQIILDQWRNAVYDISEIPPESHPKEEPHFKPRKIEDLTDNEVIETVEKFLNGLENHITGRGTNIREGYISLSFGAKHCKQTPTFEQFGEFS